MKKIYALLIMVAFAITLSACGPNSDYYNLSTENIYYYKNETLEFDPYTYLLDYNSWLEKGTLNAAEKNNINLLKNKYEVEVEYRPHGTHENYQPFAKNEENPNGLLTYDTEKKAFVSDNPLMEVGTGKKYDMKIHFINRETQSRDTMINYAGVFSFISSPANAVAKVKSLDKGTKYNLLDNIIQRDADNKAVDLTKLYDITYKVTLDGSLFSSTELNTSKTEPYSVTFDKVGTYEVLVTLTAKASETDDTSSASGGGGDDIMILNIRYTVQVDAPEQE